MWNARVSFSVVWDIVGCMGEFLELDGFDAEFAARTNEEDWRRILVLRNNPRMLEGVLSYDALIPEYFANNVILNRVAIELSRLQMIVYTLHLHDTFDPRDPRTGLTHSRLQKLCAAHDLASPGGWATTSYGRTPRGKHSASRKAAIARRRCSATAARRSPARFGPAPATPLAKVVATARDCSSFPSGLKLSLQTFSVHRNSAWPQPLRTIRDGKGATFSTEQSNHTMEASLRKSLLTALLLLAGSVSVFSTSASATTSCSSWKAICETRGPGCAAKFSACMKSGCWTEGAQYGNKRHCKLSKS